MFTNRSFNLLVGLVIAVLVMAGLQVYTADADCDIVPVVTSIPGCTSAFIPDTRAISDGYATLKDRALNRLDGASPHLASVYLSSAERYAALKAGQLERAEALTMAEPFGIAVTGAVRLTNAERYANLKDAQLARADPGVAISAGHTRYMNLKEAQFDK